MTAATATRWRPIASALAAMAILAAAAFIVIHKGPAQASHGDTLTLDVPDSSIPRNVTAGTDTTFDANLPAPATKATLILMEVEGTPNDSDPTSGPPESPGRSYGSPDAFCTVAAGDQTCQITYRFGVLTTTIRDQLRFWINGHTVDTQESNADFGQQGHSAGCVEEDPDTLNQDFTDAMDVVVTGLTQGTPPAQGPVPPGANPSPPTCENASPAPTTSGSPTPTQSETGSPSPTPTQSDTGSPSPSPSPSQTQTGGGGGASLTMGTAPAIGVFGTDFVISGEVKCQGVLIPNATVQIFRRYIGSGTFRTTEAQTDVQGRYAYRDSDLPNSAFYSGAWSGNPSCPSGTDTGNNPVKAEVRPGVVLNARDVTLRRGDTAVFFGSVIPRHPGKKVWLQMYSGNPQTWRFVAEARLNSSGNYTVFYRNTGSGFLLFRLAYPTQDLDHAWNVSRNLRVDWA